jgi:hypothetical protein
MMRFSFLTTFLFAISAQASTPTGIAFERFSHELRKDFSQFGRLSSAGFYFDEINRLGGSLNSAEECSRSLSSGSWDLSPCAPVHMARIGGTGGVE